MPCKHVPTRKLYEFENDPKDFNPNASAKSCLPHLANNHFQHDIHLPSHILMVRFVLEFRRCCMADPSFEVLRASLHEVTM